MTSKAWGTPNSMLVTPLNQRLKAEEIKEYRGLPKKVFL